MMLGSRSLHSRLPRVLAAAALCALAAHDAQAQSRWTADKRASLAWWQINPHLNHLWATTCPEEPSWRPGEGRSGGWVIDPRGNKYRFGQQTIEESGYVYTRR